MTVVTRAVVAAAVLGAFWLGVLTAPLMDESKAIRPEHSDARLEADPPTPRATAAPRPAPARAELVSQPELRASAESVQKQAKPHLASGTDTRKAAEGFDSAEDFLAIVYAARKTGIPFMLLKHRVLAEGHTLAGAIRMSKPDLDARAESDRARTKARAQITLIAN